MAALREAEHEPTSTDVSISSKGTFIGLYYLSLLVEHTPYQRAAEYHAVQNGNVDRQRQSGTRQPDS